MTDSKKNQSGEGNKGDDSKKGNASNDKKNQPDPKELQKQAEDAGYLDESAIEKAGEAAKQAQKANQLAARTQDPDERKKLLTEAANQNKTLQTLQSGALQGAAAGGGVGLATGAGLGTVVGGVVGTVSYACSFPWEGRGFVVGCRADSRRRRRAR